MDRDKEQDGKGTEKGTVVRKEKRKEWTMTCPHVSRSFLGAGARDGNQLYQKRPYQVSKYHSGSRRSRPEKAIALQKCMQTGPTELSRKTGVGTQRSSLTYARGGHSRGGHGGPEKAIALQESAGALFQTALSKDSPGQENPWLTIGFPPSAPAHSQSPVARPSPAEYVHLQRVDAVPKTTEVHLIRGLPCSRAWTTTHGPN
eukprot:5128705-Pyramimonas_sp.AAC.2